MKTLGIIGGLGPESTIDYYGKIIALYRERTGDGSYPQFIINSINMKKGLDFMEANNLAGMADYLLEELGKLGRAGALGIVDRMKAKHDIDGVILAGTELPLILRDREHNGIPFLDMTEIHCEVAVTEMLS